MGISAAEDNIFAGEGRGEAQVFNPTNAMFGPLATEQELLKKDIGKAEDKKKQDELDRKNSRVGAMGPMAPVLAGRFQESVEQYNKLYQKSVREGTYEQDKYKLEEMRDGLKITGKEYSTLSKEWWSVDPAKVEDGSYKDVQEYMTNALDSTYEGNNGALYGDTMTKIKGLVARTKPAEWAGKIKGIAIKNYEKDYKSIGGGNYEITEYMTPERIRIIAKSAAETEFTPKEQQSFFAAFGGKEGAIAHIEEFLTAQYPNKKGIKTSSGSGNGAATDFDTGYVGTSIRFNNPVVPGGKGVDGVTQANHNKYGWKLQKVFADLVTDFEAGKVKGADMNTQLGLLKNRVENKNGEYYKEMLGSFSRVTPLPKVSGSKSFKTGEKGNGPEFAGYPEKLVEDENGDLYVELRSSTGDNTVTGIAYLNEENLGVLNNFYSSTKAKPKFNIDKLKIMLDKHSGTRDDVVQNQILPELYNNIYDYEVPQGKVFDERFPGTKLKDKTVSPHDDYINRNIDK